MFTTFTDPAPAATTAAITVRSETMPSNCQVEFQHSKLVENWCFGSSGMLEVSPYAGPYLARSTGRPPWALHAVLHP
jgi:hypothetical protein